MPDLPDALIANPNLSDWVEFDNQERTVIIRTGKVELGQGIKTAIATIAAEELDVRITQVRVQTGNTVVGPNEFMTAGSMSIEGSGSAVRQAAAQVRGQLLHRASIKLGIDAKDLIVEEGLIKNRSGNESTSYWELDNDLTGLNATGDVSPKSHELYKQVGSREMVTRLDLPAKITGGIAFLQDEVTTDTLYGCIVRPPGLAYELLELDPDPVEQLHGVITVVVDGSFVGVVAVNQFCAIKAKEKLQQIIRWRKDSEMKLPPDIPEFLRSNAGISLLVQDGVPVTDPIPASMDSPDIKAQYFKPYTLHGSIGPSAALATYTPDATIKLHILSHSQGPYVIRGAIAQALGMDAQAINVEHRENAGCYGHNGADDAAMDAAMLALHVPNRQIMLQWQRQDEHVWEPRSPAMQIDMAARMTKGRITSWQADVYSQSHMGRPVPFGRVSNLIAAWHKSKPMPRAEARPGMAAHGGIHRNADPYYDFEEKRITKNLVLDQRIRTSSTRSLGAFANVFAIESFMDEIAHHTRQDPIQLRLDHLGDGRAIQVIETMRKKAQQYTNHVESPWKPGCGFAFARYKNTKCYAGVAMFLAVNEQSFDIRLIHAVIVADAGLIIDRDGLANQLEGGMIQAASWTLKESVQFDEFDTISTDWESYPILTFPEVPTVEVLLLDQPGEPCLGAGEATQGPTPAAISNAIFDAVGLRIREMPFSPDNLRQVALQG